MPKAENFQSLGQNTCGLKLLQNSFWPWCNFSGSYGSTSICEKFVTHPTNSKSGQIIEDDFGFTYWLTYKGKTGKNSWSCSKQYKGCKAYVITYDQNIIRRKHEHSNH